jgi:ribosomal protein S15P/S13E
VFSHFRQSKKDVFEKKKAQKMFSQRTKIKKLKKISKKTRFSPGGHHENMSSELDKI